MMPRDYRDRGRTGDRRRHSSAVRPIRWPVDARTGLPVVGMVGAGQLARMTHQAAIAAGPVAAAAGRLRRRRRRAGRRRRRGRRLPLAGRPARPSPSAATCVTFDHEHVPGEHIAALEADGRRPCCPGAAALRFAQDKAAMRRAADRARRARARAGATCRRVDPRRAGRVRRRGRLAAGAQGDHAAATTARASGWSDSAAERRAAAGLAAPPLLAEEKVADRARARRRRRPLAVRAGRGVAGGRDRPARRHLRRGDRPGAAASTPSRPSTPQRAGAADRRASSASSGCWRSSCS